jgi:hypothetical protein
MNFKQIHNSTSLQRKDVPHVIMYWHVVFFLIDLDIDVLVVIASKKGHDICQ